MTWLHGDTTLFISAALRSPPVTQPDYLEDEAPSASLTPEKLQAGGAPDKVTSSMSP